MFNPPTNNLASSHSNNSSITSRLTYFICSRNAGILSVTFSIIASCIGGTATIAMITLGCNAGWPSFWWLGSGGIGLAALGFLLAKKIRATRAASLPEVAYKFMGQQCRILTAIIVLLSSIAIVAAQFNAIGVILSSLIKFDFTLSVIIGSFLIWLYTCIGGQNAVIKSDIWQFLFLAFSLLLFLLFLLAKPECRLAVSTTPFEFYNDKLPPYRIIYFIFIFGSSFLIGPMIFGRLLSAKTPRVAKTASIWAATGLTFMAFLITLIGIAISGLQLNAKTPDQLIPLSLHFVLPEWAIIIVLFGLLAAVVSSADSCLLSAAVVWCNDIIPGGIRETRIAMTIIAALSCLIVFSGKSILDLLLAASDIFVCGIVCPMLAAILCDIKIKTKTWLFPIICGGICGIISALTGNPNWSFTGLGLSLFLSVFVLLYIKNKTAFN